MVLLIILLIIGGCQQPSKQLLNEFKIQPNSSNIIQGEKGTILIIPANAFVYEDGTEVKEEITLKLIEAYSLLDMLENGLETRAADGLLVTGGMINLEATTISDKKVIIDGNKEIILQVAESLSDTNNYQFFNQEDQIWTNPIKPSPYLTYFPIKMQSILYMYSDTEDSINWDSISFTKDKTILIDKYITDTTSIDLYIKNRYYIYDDITRTFIKGRDYYTNYDKTLNMSFISSKEYDERFSAFPPFGEGLTVAHDIYLDNLDKPLWVVDSMIIDEYTADLVYYEKSSNWGDYNFMLRAIKGFTKFKNQYKTTFPPNTFTKEELEELKKIYEKQEVNTLLQSYQVRKLGWHNIDYFYKTTNLLPTSLTVKCNHQSQVFLVFKSAKVIIKATEIENKNYCFETAKECIAGLPQIQAYIIAMAEENGELLFAKKEILIGKNKVETLDLKPITPKEMKTILVEIDENYNPSN